MEEKSLSKEKRKSIIEWGIYIALLAAVFIIFHFFLMLGRIPSESMEPTLMVHDWTVGDRNAYTDSTPERGDIIIFYCESEEEVMVKRVIGLPGETVTFVGGRVYIDGEPLDESEYLDDDVVTESDDTFVVPEGDYFMLGDNREVSLDSRYWDNPYITVDDIHSKVLWVIPFHKLPWY
jgi:signal peptidase I